MPTPFATLRGLTRPRAAPAPAVRDATEHCELCSARIGPGHRHLLEVAARQVRCACDPCALRFEAVIGGRFKLIPRDAYALPDFQVSDAEWEDLSLPISLAFFFHSTPAARTMALYPSPAGATESLLPLAAWRGLVEKNRVLTVMEPDVEALLVNRTHGTQEYFLAPIDACFELVGTIRLHWRGFSGGEEVWRQIAAFFTRLRENARQPREVPHA